MEPNIELPLPLEPPTFAVASPPEEQPFSLDVREDIKPVSPMDADPASFKVFYGLGDILKKSRQDIYGDLVMGNGPKLQEQAAAEIDYRKKKATQDAIVSYTQNKQGNLQPQDIDFITNAVTAMNEKTDPETVFERAWAKEYLKAMERTAERNAALNQIKLRAENQEVYANDTARGEELATKSNFLKTMQKEARRNTEDQSYVGYGVDFAKNFIPFYSDFKLRGRGPVGTFSGGLTGSHLEQQAAETFRLPMDQFKKTIKDNYQAISKDNPQLAEQYLDYMSGMSTADVVMNNVFPLIDLATLPIGKAAKSLVAGKVAMVNDNRGAIKTMIKRIENAEPTPANIQDAAGDVHAGAVQKFTANVTQELTNPEDVAVQTRIGFEALPSALRTDLADINAKPGGYTEAVNRINERYATVASKLETAVVDKNSVERLPEVLQREASARAILDDMKDKHVGVSNRYIDQEPFYKEKITGNWFTDAIIGDAQAKYFFSRETAENFARSRGWLSAKVEGKEGVEVGAQRAMSDREAKRVASLENTIKETEEVTIPKWREQLAKETDVAKQEKLVEDIEGSQELMSKYKADVAKMKGTDEIGATIEQQGVGYYIRLPRPVTETSNVLRHEIEKLSQVEGSSTYSPRGWANALFGKWRTPGEVLSHSHIQNREAATYGPSILIDLVNESVKDINALVGWKGIGNQQRRNDWMRAVESAMDILDENGKMGKFFRDPEEFAQHYQNVNKRLPDDKEVAAYFAFKQTNELDRMFRNISEYRYRGRVGGETFEYFTQGTEGKVGTGKFTGVLQKTLPKTDENILVMGKKGGQEQVLNASKLDATIRADLEDGIKTGRLVLTEVYAPELREFSQFKNVGDTRVRYVIGESSTQEALKWEHVPRRGGGHVVYDYDFYLKQAMVKKETVDGITTHWYEGDRTIMPVSIRAMGKDIAEKLNSVRELIRDGKIAEAEALSNKHLPVSWEEVSGWFKPSRSAEGKHVPAMLSPDDPILVVDNGKRIVDMGKDMTEKYGSTFRDGTKSGSLSRQYQVEFTEERGNEILRTWADNGRGSKGSPLYDVAPADRLDPITSMNRALSRIIKTNYFDDYKIFSVEHWLAEANQYLKADLSIIRHSPFWHFKNALSDFTAAVPAEIKARLEAQHFQINQLLGVPSETNNIMQRVSQKLADSIYTTLGAKGELLQPVAQLPLIRDPLKFLRSAVFHSNLGMFNLPQFIVQGMNYVNMLGIAGPRTAMSGTYAAQLHFWSTVNRNPEILKHLDNMATKINLPGMSAWKPGEFTEAMKTMEKTGFGNVGREYAVLDDLMSQKVITSLGQPILESGAMFFKGGERNARYGAWYTAFKEFRDIHPTGKLTQADEAKILERANILSGDMSRASSSRLHTGVLAIPMQFYTYQLRVAELVLGNRLTWQEKARLIGTNAAFFGAPVSLGVTGLPFADHIRQYALENGYVVGENFLTDLTMNGIPAVMGAWITGAGDPKKGVQMNFGDRFGTKGFEQIAGFLRGDKTVMDIVGGAAWSKLSSTWEQADGFRAAMMGMIRNDRDFPMTAEDYADVFKEINSFKTAWGLAAAVQTGRWASKKEIYMTDVSPLQAIFQSVTGTTEQAVADVQRKSKSLKDQKEKEMYAEKQFTQEFKRFIHATKDNNPEQAQTFLRRARAFLDLTGYPQDKITNLVSKAAEDNLSLVQKIDWSFYLKGPDAQHKTRTDSYMTQNALKQGRI